MYKYVCVASPPEAQPKRGRTLEATLPYSLDLQMSQPPLEACTSPLLVLQPPQIYRASSGNLEIGRAHV